MQSCIHAVMHPMQSCFFFNSNLLKSNKVYIMSSNTKKKEPISRKKFFKRIGLFSLIPLAGIWYSTSKRTELREKQIIKVSIPSNIPDGISFYDSVIVSKGKGHINVFSSKCTHLGCLINKTENEVLICPCHGSQYAFDGKVIKGPANKSLKKLPFKINTQTGEISVDVQI